MALQFEQFVVYSVGKKQIERVKLCISEGGTFNILEKLGFFPKTYFFWKFYSALPKKTKGDPLVLYKTMLLLNRSCIAQD